MSVALASSPSSALPACPHDPRSPARFKTVLQAGDGWIAASPRRELSVPRGPSVPVPTRSRLGSCMVQNLIRGRGSNPSPGAVGAPWRGSAAPGFLAGQREPGTARLHPGGLVLARGVAAKPRPSAWSIRPGKRCQARMGNTQGCVPGASPPPPAGTCHRPRQELGMLTLSCRGLWQPREGKAFMLEW